MSDQHIDANRNCNIWAPWRTEYIESLSESESGCFLCTARDETDRDAENLVLWRGPRTLTVLNRYPYTGGHALIAPLDHVGDMADLDDATLLEMMRVARDMQTILSDALKAQGFNIGYNIGRCAGAGLPEHLHMHVVPRWAGDVNMLTVLGHVRVVPISLEQLYDTITEAARSLDLPRFEADGV
jgi:ATP adenylyltransferase